MSSGALRDELARAAAISAAEGGVGGDGRVRVEVLHHLDDPDIKNKIESVGGVVEEAISGHLTQARVPPGGLIKLEHDPGVTAVRPPMRVNLGPTQSTPSLATTGEEVAAMNATAWHAAGFTGRDVKVGIIDVFSSDTWSAARTADAVPAEGGTFCVYLGKQCDVFSIGGSGEKHGAAVAEIVHEMAPDAQLYLAFAWSAADLQAAVDYFHAQGVKIITRSLATPYDGPGDGTGPIDAVIDNAVTDGMTWFNSAGNSAGQTGVTDGGYWRGRFVDAGDGSGYNKFPDGSESMLVTCNSFSFGLRWNGWNKPAAAVSDYDLYVFDLNGNPIASSTDRQGASGGSAQPLENFPNDEIRCNTLFAFIKIKRVAAGTDAANDVLEFQVNGGAVQFWSNPYSADVPIVDSANHGAVGVGAMDPPNGTTIAPYSAWGPTNDNRIKPDLVTPSCVSNFSYSPECFNGTSAATPAAAGAAALVLSAGVATTPASLGDYLRGHSTDRGDTGPDDVYGNGELILPSPPGAPVPTPIPSATPTPAPSATPAPTSTPISTGAPTATPTEATGTIVVTSHPVIAGHVAMIDVKNIAPVGRYDLWLHSTPARMGSASADETGSFSLAFTVPPTTSPGEHTLEVMSVAGGPALARTSVTISPDVSLATTSTTTSTVQPTKLPSTGADIVRMVRAGLLLIVFGGGLTLWARRKRTSRAGR